MEYVAEIWFGNVVLKIDLETYNRADEVAALEVAQKIAEKLGGECFSIHAQEE